MSRGRLTCEVRLFPDSGGVYASQSHSSSTSGSPTRGSGSAPPGPVPPRPSPSSSTSGSPTRGSGSASPEPAPRPSPGERLAQKTNTKFCSPYRWQCSRGCPPQVYEQHGAWQSARGAGTRSLPREMTGRLAKFQLNKGESSQIGFRRTDGHATFEPPPYTNYHYQIPASFEQTQRVPRRHPDVCLCDVSGSSLVYTPHLQRK